jgi:hypothetical protein
MNLGEQLSICSEHYQKWKSVALNSFNKVETRKALDRAFFWLELQSAFIALHAVERTGGNNEETRRKLFTAKANLSKKLAEYAKEILSEL